jgi:hypothetical protein
LLLLEVEEEAEVEVVLVGKEVIQGTQLLLFLLFPLVRR